MTLVQRCGDGQVLKLMSASASIPVLRPSDAAGARHVARYIDELRTVGVRLPTDVRIVQSGCRPAVQHLWVPGTPLPTLAVTDPPSFVSAVRRIATWVESLDATVARLDTNLANFISTGDGLVCIDVLPPLLIFLRPPENDDWQRLFGGLCYDTDVTLCALAGLYPGHDVPDRLPAWWFHTRNEAVLSALRGQTPRETALQAFTLTSVLRLRNTPPERRQERIDAALAAVRCLGLGRTRP